MKDYFMVVFIAQCESVTTFSTLLVGIKFKGNLDDVEEDCPFYKISITSW